MDFIFFMDAMRRKHGGVGLLCAFLCFAPGGTRAAQRFGPRPRELKMSFNLIAVPFGFGFWVPADCDSGERALAGGCEV
jgi:hypothetical protein